VYRIGIGNGASPDYAHRPVPVGPSALRAADLHALSRSFSDKAFVM
jgi:hypothetical protein